MPLEEAIAGNREWIANYLAKAEEAQRSLTKRSDAVGKEGIDVPGPALPSLAEVRIEVERLFPQDAGSVALKYAHRYYQNLKHPWLEKLDAAEKELVKRAVENERMNKKAAMSTELTNEIEEARKNAQATVKRISSQTSRRDGEVKDAAIKYSIATEYTVEERTRKAVEGLLCSARDEQDSIRVKADIDRIVGETPSLIVVRLEEMLLERTDQENRECDERVAAEMTKRQIARFEEESNATLERSSDYLVTVGVTEATKYRERFEECFRMAGEGKLMAAEAKFAETHSDLMKRAVAATSVLQIVQFFRKRGYREATAMNTITAGDFAVAELVSPDAPDRIVEMRYNKATQAVSLEIVRAVSDNGTEAQVAEDMRAQKRLCHDVDHIVQQLDGKSIKVQYRGAIGRKARVSERKKNVSHASGAAQGAALMHRSMNL